MGGGSLFWFREVLVLGVWLHVCEVFTLYAEGVPCMGCVFMSSLLLLMLH